MFILRTNRVSPLKRQPAAISGMKNAPPRRGKAGQALVLTTMSLFCLLGFVGLSVDMGYLRMQKRRIQSAADAAALSAMAELNYGDSTTWAKKDSASNGFTDGSNNVTVVVNHPPTLGHYSGNANYVEAIVTQTVPTFFMKALSINSVTLTGRAVAGTGNGPACLYALDPAAPGAFTINGNATVTSHCGVIDNSSSGTALTASGNLTFTATNIGVVGNYVETGNVHVNPQPTAGIVPASDPLAYVPSPTVGACNHTNFSLSGKTTATLTPGVYCGGMSFTGGVTVTFNPGTYILAGGGLKVIGNATLSGTGVTFYDTTGLGGYQGISLAGTAQITLSAPTSGPLEAMLFMEDRTVTSGLPSTITGNTSSTFDGAVYFPTTPVSYTGNSSASGYTILVADTVTIAGNTTQVIGNNYSSLGNGSPIKTTVLAE